MCSGDAGDVALGHVQLVEDVLDGLDLVAVDDLVAEADEDVLDLPADLRDRVEPAARDALAGKRDVDALLESRGEALTPDSLLGFAAGPASSVARSSFSALPVSRSRTWRNA